MCEYICDFRDVFWKYILFVIYYKVCVNIWIIRCKNVKIIFYFFFLLCIYWKSFGFLFSGLEKKLKMRSVWENVYYDNDVDDNNDDNIYGIEKFRWVICIWIIIFLYNMLFVNIIIVI